MVLGREMLTGFVLAACQTHIKEAMADWDGDALLRIDLTKVVAEAAQEQRARLERRTGGMGGMF